MSCESSIADFTMEMMEDDCREQLLSHIRELHEAVVEMKGAFTAAQLQLQNVSTFDQDALSQFQTDLGSTRNLCERQGGDILQMVLALKGEVACIKEALQSIQCIQHGHQSSVRTILMERDILLDELSKNGAISENIRVRLHSRLNECTFPRPSSGSHSHGSSNDNDSGVALLSLAEKAHAAFQPLQDGGNGLQGGGSTIPPSDLASLANHSANANVQEYLNTLGSSSHGHHHLHHLTTGEGRMSHGRNTQNGQIVSEDLNMMAFNGVVYDSDCSLTLAATKSLSLSNSLSKQCGLELVQDQEQQSAEKESILSTKGHEQEGGSGQNLSDLLEGHIPFKEGQRLKVAKELLETERKYCHTLRTIQETFATPLKNSGVLSIKDINTLFPEEVFSLYEKHVILLSQLEERIASWKNQPTIGDILERFTNGKGSDVLRLYTNYVNDFPEVLKTFHKLCRSSREFTQFLKSSLEHPACGGLDLGAFLLSPVQRMPRYILLLKQIIKYTDSNHPDYNDITTCLDRLRDYLKRLNDSMEHSFQLVTAQISPQPVEHNQQDKKIGFTNALGLGFGFGSRSAKNVNPFARTSVCSSHSRSSHSTTGDLEEGSRGHDRGHKTRYRRSTSVPRQVQIPTSDQSYHHSPALIKDLSTSTDKGKLKARSKSDWTVCKACNCSQNQIPLPPDIEDDIVRADPRYDHHINPCLERTLSDSDINSDADEDSPFLSPQKDKNGRKFSTSKSLHDFPHQHADWFHSSQPSLCDQIDNDPHPNPNPSNTQTIVRNKVLVRPLTTAPPGRYVARIQRGSESEMNLHMIGLKNSSTIKSLDQTKKKTSLRTSLKNIFSLKKRTTRTLQISGPILPSKATPFPPPPVATLRYNNGREVYQSLPPEPAHPPPGLNLLQGRRSRDSQTSSRTSDHGRNTNANSPSQGPSSLPNPPPLPPFPVALARFYARNPGSKFSNPKIPKTPFMTKYQRASGSSPYTDV